MINKQLNIITHMSFKGGSSKTCLNLNFALQFCNNYPDKKVLFIDADPQSNSSVYVLGEEVLRANVNTLKSGIENNMHLNKLIIKNPIERVKNFDIIPSNISMITLELLLNARAAKEYTLLNYLSKEENVNFLKNYDLIIFDLNPAISVLNTNVFLCCNHIIPILNYGCYSTIIGYEILLDTYNDIKNALRINKNDIRKPIITKFKKQENSKIKMWLECAESKDILKNTFKQTMRESIHYENSILFNQPISEYLSNKKIKTDIGDEMTNLINEYISEGVINL